MSFCTSIPASAQTIHRPPHLIRCQPTTSFCVHASSCVFTAQKPRRWPKKWHRFGAVAVTEINRRRRRRRRLSARSAEGNLGRGSKVAKSRVALIRIFVFAVPFACRAGATRCTPRHAMWQLRAGTTDADGEAGVAHEDPLKFRFYVLIFLKFSCLQAQRLRPARPSASRPARPG